MIKTGSCVCPFSSEDRVEAFQSPIHPDMAMCPLHIWTDAFAIERERPHRYPPRIAIGTFRGPERYLY